MADAPEKTYLQFNGVNFVTIAIMGLAVICAIGIGVAGFKHFFGDKSENG